MAAAVRQFGETPREKKILRICFTHTFRGSMVNAQRVAVTKGVEFGGIGRNWMKFGGISQNELMNAGSAGGQSRERRSKYGRRQKQ